VLIWRRFLRRCRAGAKASRNTLARTLALLHAGDLPCVLRGQRTLVAAHGNSLRELIMVLEKLSAENILNARTRHGVPIIYRLNADSTVATKLDLAA